MFVSNPVVLGSPGAFFVDGMMHTVQGSTFINQYLILQNLGRGAQGKVKLCLNTDDNLLYAVKVRGVVAGIVSLRAGSMLASRSAEVCPCGSVVLVEEPCEWSRCCGDYVPPVWREGLGVTDCIVRAIPW